MFPNKWNKSSHIVKKPYKAQVGKNFKNLISYSHHGKTDGENHAALVCDSVSWSVLPYTKG